MAGRWRLRVGLPPRIRGRRPPLADLRAHVERDDAPPQRPVGPPSRQPRLAPLDAGAGKVGGCPRPVAIRCREGIPDAATGRRGVGGAEGAERGREAHAATEQHDCSHAQSASSAASRASCAARRSSCVAAPARFASIHEATRARAASKARRRLEPVMRCELSTAGAPVVGVNAAPCVSLSSGRAPHLKHTPPPRCSHCGKPPPWHRSQSACLRFVLLTPQS